MIYIIFGAHDKFNFVEINYHLDVQKESYHTTL